MDGTVYWVELQSELSGVGLNVAVAIPRPGYPWSGTVNDKPFTMSIPPKSKEDGIRDFMIVSLFGQEEEKVIPFLSKFMSYEPFCRYEHKKLSGVSATYEWDRKNSNARFKELGENADVYELTKLEKGFQVPQTKDMQTFFQQFTPEVVEKWEKAVQANPDAEWNSNRVRSILPFVKKVMPRIGRNQSLFGLSIISLDGKAKDERELVQYGLEPLLVGGILTEEEVKQIVGWFLNTQPTWDSGGAGHFQKEFEIDGMKYRLISDSYRNCRDLNLQVLS